MDAHTDEALELSAREAPATLWVRLTDAFLPRPAPRDLDQLRRLRTSIGVALMVMPISAACGLVLYLGFPGPVGETAASLYAGSIAGLLATLVLLRTRGWFTVSTNLMIGYFAALYLAVGYHMGGPTSPILYPLLVVPLCALVVLGWVSCLAWLGAVGLIHVTLLALHDAGRIPRFSPSQAHLDLLWLLSTSATLLLIAAVVGNFERARNEALGMLKSARRHLERARREAEAANQDKSAFLTKMGHEIRTPMSAVLGFSDVALELAAAEPVAERDRRALRAIQGNAQDLLRILDDMLDLSRIEAGRIEVRPGVCRTDELLEQAASLLRAQARARGTELVVERAPGTPEELHTDALRLQQILVNLLGNAIRSCEEGEVRLLARPLRHEQADWIRLEVCDSGKGMSAARLAAVRQAFMPAEDSTQRRYVGAGLGLSISRVLAELLGGQISADSEPGRGSTFRVDLPLAPLRRGPGVGRVPAVSAPAPAAGALTCRILFIDDLSDNRRLIGHFLKRAGASVSLASSGEDALRQERAARQSGAPFDLIITDIQMPRMDGYAARCALREQGCAAPILALTAHALATERERCLAAGFDDYASKPIDRAKLIEWVARNLERGAPGPARAARAAPTAPFVERRSLRRRSIDALVRAVTPPDLRQDASALRRARTVLLSALVLAALAPIAAIPGSNIGSHALAVLVVGLDLFFLPVVAGALLAYRWSGSLPLAIGTMVGYGMATTTAVTYLNGGSESMVPLYYAFYMMVAMGGLGVRAGVLLTVVALGIDAVFWAVSALGLGPPDMFLQSVVAANTTNGTLVLAVLLTGTGLIHERAKAEALLQLTRANGGLDAARQEAEQSRLAKSYFLANISHELRTPLTAILGFGELLAARWRERSPDSELCHAISTIRRAGSQLLGVINDLLDLAKSESGSLRIDSVEFDPAQLIADALEPLRPRAADKGIHLEANLATPLPARMYGDPMRIGQIIAHLCSNALKFTEQGRIRISASALQRGPDPWLHLSVSDTGCGIPAEQLGGLFTPFHQVDDSSTRAHGGTGLGLALCRRLAELMDGTMHVASEVESGSCFTFELPLRPVAGSGYVHELPAAHVQAAACRALLRLRLVLAEGGADNRLLIARMLRDAGAEVDIAHSGALAVDCALAAVHSGQPHDLILLDMDAPAVAGAQAARALRDAGIAAPILALTTQSPAEQRECCLAAGCSDLATKPLDWSALFEQIAALTNKRRGAQD